VAYAQGDPADAIFYVQKGRLRVTVTSPTGKEATIALVGVGEFSGENCVVSAHPLRFATATAMTECTLLRIR
jgi:CRP-like cAMP-binding protein